MAWTRSSPTSQRDDAVLAGVSAGANCWYEACSTDSFGPLAPLRDGLGLLPGSFCPHFDGEQERADSVRAWVREGLLPKGWAADDGAALHWRDGVIVDHLVERPGAATHRITAA